MRFEKSPYAIRGLELVYSAQEDMTFFVWRLRDGINTEDVYFELYEDGDFRVVDLADTAYPAEPYVCGDGYLCYQYQRDGRFEWPRDVERPLRSVHVDEGVYAGGVPDVQAAEFTLEVDPIGLDNNVALDFRLGDWFARNGVPMRRGFEYQLVSAQAPYGQGSARNCDAPGDEGWAVAADPRREPIDHDWVETPKCFALRPVHTSGRGRILLAPVRPSAELFFERQDYIPLEERPPVLYAYLIDMLIRGTRLCTQTKDGLVGAVDEWVGRRDPRAVRLGRFTPIDSETGRPADGCSQTAEQSYPILQLSEALTAAAEPFDPVRVRFVLVYINNVALPPGERVLLQFLLLQQQLAEATNVVPYTLAIGSNDILNAFGPMVDLPLPGPSIGFDDTIGFRPLSDRTLLGDIRAWAETTIPFRTQLHDETTQVTIREPVRADARPEFFKICRSRSDFPDLSGVLDLPEEPLPLDPEEALFGEQGILAVGPGFGGMEFDPPDDEMFIYPWPRQGEPYYRLGLLEQVLVPFTEYFAITTSTSVEACTRFCTFPFRKAGVGRNPPTDFESWLSVSDCQEEQTQGAP
ncbi:MAG: hypothetical protein AAGI01_13825 [Myxococcota bacterium]